MRVENNFSTYFIYLFIFLYKKNLFNIISKLQGTYKKKIHVMTPLICIVFYPVFNCVLAVWRVWLVEPIITSPACWSCEWVICLRVIWLTNTEDCVQRLLYTTACQVLWFWFASKTLNSCSTSSASHCSHCTLTAWPGQRHRTAFQHPEDLRFWCNGFCPWENACKHSHNLTFPLSLPSFHKGLN